jgi:hypothetical protein
MAEKPAQDLTELEALQRAVNAAAQKGTTLWLSFVFFATLLIISVGTVTHKHLFLAQPLKLPVLNVELPLAGFFVAAPLFFLVFHFYALLQLHGLVSRVQVYSDRLERVVPSDEARWLIRQRMDPSVFVQMLAGVPERRIGFVGLSNRVVPWITMVVLPLSALVLILLVFCRFMAA